jgi:hypothetical protein
LLTCQGIKPPSGSNCKFGTVTQTAQQSLLEGGVVDGLAQHSFAAACVSTNIISASPVRTQISHAF